MAILIALGGECVKSEMLGLGRNMRLSRHPGVQGIFHTVASCLLKMKADWKLWGTETSTQDEEFESDMMPAPQSPSSILLSLSVPFSFSSFTPPLLPLHLFLRLANPSFLLLLLLLSLFPVMSLQLYFHSVPQSIVNSILFSPSSLSHIFVALGISANLSLFILSLFLIPFFFFAQEVALRICCLILINGNEHCAWKCSGFLNRFF